jgi:CDP-4-dehydro-6-deoxyglucose reductase
MPYTFAKPFQCRVLDVVWLTSSVVKVRFEPSKKFDFQPGQFLSVVIPPFHRGGEVVKRCYSFASGPEESKQDGYELCVKFVEGGAGSSFLGSLAPGDVFTAQAPYGDFVYRPTGDGRSVVFVCTGTGIAPFRSAVFSDLFHAEPPKRALCLQGVATPGEILYPGEFASMGVEEVYAVSRSDADWKGFKGRVTDYLRQMPREFPWHSTDFYLCGNGPMIQEVSALLQGFGVPSASVHKENFSSPKPAPQLEIVQPVLQRAPQKKQLITLPEAA